MKEQIKDWNKVTKEELFDYSFRQSMCDFEVAKIYGVTSKKVSYKRNKFNLKRSYGSDAYKRLTAEQAIEGISMACGMDKKYEQKLKDVLKEYFNR